MLPRHAALLALATLTGCGGMGLDPLVDDSGLLGGAGGASGATLAIEPQGAIDFGRVDPDGRSALRDVVLSARGQGMVAVVGISLSSDSSSAFTLRNADELPLPIRLEGGQDFPVQLAFLPYATGSFTGRLVVEVDDNGELETLTRDLAGEGCDPEVTPDCA